LNKTAVNVQHQPVLLDEVLEGLQVRPGGHYVDGTLGAGGHARAILEQSAPDGELLAFDVDPEAIRISQSALEKYGNRVIMQRSSYTNMSKVVAELGVPNPDGILLDLGASSMQFDQAQRGFSFQNEGPLDMRFDLDSTHSANAIVNEWSAQGLKELLETYGEQPRARKVADAIVNARPIENTTQLAEIVARALRSKKRGIHPATKTFQALRIAVNSELDNLSTALPDAISLLAEGGRLAVISFHSLEDRIVKRFFNQESKDCICPPEQLICTCGHQAQIVRITRKPIMAGEDELKINRRSRSAKLRIVEKKKVNIGI